MSNLSKSDKESSEKSNYLKLYDLDYKDIKDDFYDLVDNDLLLKVVESKMKKKCPPEIDYIVLSDSDDENQDSTKRDKAKLSEKPSVSSSPSETKKFLSTEATSLNRPKISSPAPSKSSTNQNFESKNSEPAPIQKSESNEKLKENISKGGATSKTSSPAPSKSSTNQNFESKNSEPAPIQKSESNEKLKENISKGGATSKTSSPALSKSSTNQNFESKNSEPSPIQKSESNEKNARSMSPKKNIHDNMPSIFSGDDEEEDVFPLSRLNEEIKSSENENESDFDELSEKLIKKEWCICPNSQNKENLKTCDKCGQWFHILCAADSATKKKVQSGVKVSLIDDFRCLLCRNDQEAIKKFDPKMIEQRIKQRNERLSLSDSDQELTKPKVLGLSPDHKQTELKKNLNEKKILVKKKIVEQKKTKLLNVNKNRESRRKSVSTILTPKQLNQDSTKINKIVQQSSTPRSEATKISKTPSTPSERKTKLINCTNSSGSVVHKTTVKVTSDREKTKCLLFKSLKERATSSQTDMKISDKHIESLSEKIEEEIHNHLGNTNEYMDRIKIIRLNVTEKSNKTFFKKILNGVINAEQLARMDKNDMKDDDLRRQDEENLRQDLIGRIEQSDELNEDIRKKQEALRVRKGIDDDLSALATYTPAIDLNNNDKPTETIVNDASDAIETEVTSGQHVNVNECPLQPDTHSPVHEINEKKRKHDSDFESDSEVQPSVKTIRTNDIDPFDLSQIPAPKIPAFKLSHDILWSGNLNLNIKDISFKLKVNMININNFSNSSKRLRVLESFKQRLSLSAITDFKLTECEFIYPWNKINTYLTFKFEPNVNQKSLFRPQYMTNLKEYESNEVLLALYKKMEKSGSSCAIVLPQSLDDLVEKIFLCPVRKSTNETESNLKEKYGITLNRSTDSILGFLVPRIRSEARKTSPDQSKSAARKDDEAKDPRMRKPVKTSSPEHEAKSLHDTVITEAVPHRPAEANASRPSHDTAAVHSHRVISLDAYKQKHKHNSDQIESVPMDIDSPTEAGNAHSQNFILFDALLSRIRPDTSQMEKLTILENICNMNALKEMNKLELDELKTKYDGSLPEFAQVVHKLIENNAHKMEDKLDRQEEKKEEKKEKRISTKIEDNLVQQKMSLPPKQTWHGSSKESFENLLKLHKASKERKSNGLAYDLSFENKNWTLNERNFRPLDENLLNLESKSDSESNISSDEPLSTSQNFAPAKKFKCTARKSVSGLIRNFRYAKD